MFGWTSPLPLRLGGNALNGLTASQHARLAADTAAVRRVQPFATFRYTKSGATVTIVGYSGHNGKGSAFAPTPVVNGTGDVTFTWPTYYDDENDQEIRVALKAAVAQNSQSSTSGRAIVTVTARSIRVVTRNLAGGASDRECSVTVWGDPRVDKIAIGDYGGATDKQDSTTEGEFPYAWFWYREFRAARGSAFTTKTATFVHVENVALARWAAWLYSRLPEKIRANATPSGADERLSYWQRFLLVPGTPGDQKWQIRQRCAAKYAATGGASYQEISDAVSALLGDAFVGLSIAGTDDIVNNPTLTYWHYGTPGPTEYDLGPGTWLSERSHVAVIVQQPAGLTNAELNALLNVRLFQLLDDKLPAYATFGWSVGDGFILDVSRLDFTGLSSS